MRQSEVRFFMLHATRLILNYHKLKAAQPAVHTLLLHASRLTRQPEVSIFMLHATRFIFIYCNFAAACSTLLLHASRLMRQPEISIFMLHASYNRYNALRLMRQPELRFCKLHMTHFIFIYCNFAAALSALLLHTLRLMRQAARPR